MTRDRALKTLIRTRAAKTRERYTTARRHVLQALSPAGHVPKAQSNTRPPGRPAPAASNAIVRGAVTDGNVRTRTGQNLAHWFYLLDRFDAVKKGHTAAARHLR